MSVSCCLGVRQSRTEICPYCRLWSIMKFWSTVLHHNCFCWYWALDYCCSTFWQYSDILSLEKLVALINVQRLRTTKEFQFYLWRHWIDVCLKLEGLECSFWSLTPLSFLTFSNISMLDPAWLLSITFPIKQIRLMAIAVIIMLLQLLCIPLLWW